ncbi:MAG TPA: hypothetical protein VGR38_11345 [Candidatus Polarisedimenticolia bacterium]|nr:hypothetical protein [Candidatus Polarisedimenticolia bacterium]
MKRPLGVTLIACCVFSASLYALARTMGSHSSRAGQKLFLASVVLAILGLIGAEALWRLRPYAFLTFTLWAFCAMGVLVLFRLPHGSWSHPTRLFEPIVYAGLAYAVVALYLRRVV